MRNYIVCSLFTMQACMIATCFTIKNQSKVPLSVELDYVGSEDIVTDIIQSGASISTCDNSQKIGHLLRGIKFPIIGNEDSFKFADLGKSQGLKAGGPLSGNGIIDIYLTQGFQQLDFSKIYEKPLKYGFPESINKKLGKPQTLGDLFNKFDNPKLAFDSYMTKYPQDETGFDVNKNNLIRAGIDNEWNYFKEEATKLYPKLKDYDYYQGCILFTPEKSASWKQFYMYFDTRDKSRRAHFALDENNAKCMNVIKELKK